MMVIEKNGDTKEKKRISGSTLKIIAIVTMLIDHVGAVVLLRMILDNAAKSGMVGMVPADGLYQLYNVFRGIGRLAFPIFCFLLVEGFQRTGNRAKYALRMGIFALISEIPFDLALSSKVLEFNYQNVYFTLLIGLLTMIAVDAVDRAAVKSGDGNPGSILSVLRYFMELVVMFLGAYVAECLHTDYGAKGVLCILVLYFFRLNRLMQCIAGACAFLWEQVAPLAFLLVGFYDGRRGLKLKYVFYLFYPVHLLVLYLICVMLGIQGYPAV